jgi:hypothetical protein
MVKRKVSSDEEDQLANDSSEYSASPKPKARTSKREVCNTEICLFFLSRLINVCPQAKTAVKAEPDFQDQLISDEDQAPLAKKSKKLPAQTVKVSIVVHVFLVERSHNIPRSRRIRRGLETQLFTPPPTVIDTSTWGRRSALL